eukprot:scaffold3227_cov215-Prasinococcus_capsulatus_cf.AAC.1
MVPAATGMPLMYRSRHHRPESNGQRRPLLACATPSFGVATGRRASGGAAMASRQSPGRLGGSTRGRRG